ncbi:hypothetical protein BKA70DRAFT_1424151 [Coprinopsis sp. MPI-PUGE-AT-0042]|nr:hypothetical protein BKA70DRAFT_1424151 [Coprinopsis sp. MPI-PUGE-AT-0042]
MTPRHVLEGPSGELQPPVDNAQPSGMSKKQRQNAQKHEAQKAAKAAWEEERLAALARHREMSQMGGNGVNKGMTVATVNQSGKLVWE